MFSHADIQNLESIAGGSPFYLVDRQKFESNFDDLTAAFSSRYQPFVLAYSYKTNYLPYLCGLNRQKSGWAEVVSRMEYDLALKIGQYPQKIIFNGPLKSREDIRYALECGSLINLDSEEELTHVIDYANDHPDKEIPVGLRINIGLSDDKGLSHIQNSLKVGRFGFDPCQLNEKLKIDNNNLKIVSLHGHTSTTDRSKWCFEVITRTLCDIAERCFPDTVEYINIGGGFFGRMHPDMPFKNTPSFNDYAEGVCDILNANAWVRQKNPTLVIEPGVAMVANVVSFIAKVVSVKQIKDQTIITVDGSAFHAKPTFHSLNLPHQIITRQPDRPEQIFSVAGSTCMEKDYLLKDITAPRPQSGDYIKIDNVGAYTLVMTPPFIHPAPAIMADEGGRYKLVRKKQTIDEVFSNYSF